MKGYRVESFESFAVVWCVNAVFPAAKSEIKSETSGLCCGRWQAEAFKIMFAHRLNGLPGFSMIKFWYFVYFVVCA